MHRLLVLLALILGAAAPAFADGFVVVRPVEPRPPHVRTVPLRVRSHEVTVRVEGRVAVTEVDQVFANPNPFQLEGTYLFPLPEGAAIDRFSMWIDGRETSAELLDAAKARGIYEGIVREMRDPALLEYAERGLFKARIFPIEPNGEKRVRIRYAEVLSADNGTVAYRYPLHTEKYSSRPLERVSVSVAIAGGDPVASVWSPSHRIETPPAPSGLDALVSWHDAGVTPDRDFLLYWRPTTKPVAVSVLAHRDPSDPEGTFLMVLAPRPDAAMPAMPKDVVFVCDTSGSMAGPKMTQAKAALRFCLRSLGPDDAFGIVPFSTEPRPFRDALVPATAENRAAAERFVDELAASGGTAIDDALVAGLRLVLPRPAGEIARPSIVLFVTDGLPTIGTTDPDKILKHASALSGAARLFVFGVGDDVNTKLLDRLAAENRGARDYVAATEDLEEKVSNLYAKLARPAMTDLELSVTGVTVTAMHPSRLGDLFHGGEIVVTGRYAGPGDAVVRLTGRVRAEAKEIVEEIRLPAAEPRNEFLPRLWATRRVGFLLDEMRLRGETAEVRDEVVRLARRYGIVTPFTSYLIVEDERRVAAGGRSAGGGDAPDFGFLPTGGGGGAGGDRGGAPPPAAPEAAARADTAKKAAEAGEAKDKASGAGAVSLSREGRALSDFEGEKDARDDASARELVRHVGGRTFARRGGVWCDAAAASDRERRSVEAFSEAYFELVRNHPEIAPWLALGRVAFAVDAQIVEITSAP